MNLRSEEIYCEFSKGIVVGSLDKYYREYDLTITQKYEKGIFTRVENIGYGRKIQQQYAQFYDFYEDFRFLKGIVQEQKSIQFYKIDHDAFYIGFIKENMPHGLGVFSFSDGKNHIAQYNMGVVDGFGIIDFENGDKYRGQIIQDKFNNLGTFIASEWYQATFIMRSRKDTTWDNSEMGNAITLS